MKKIITFVSLSLFSMSFLEARQLELCSSDASANKFEVHFVDMNGQQKTATFKAKNGRFSTVSLEITNKATNVQARSYSGDFLTNFGNFNVDILEGKEDLSLPCSPSNGKVGKYMTVSIED